MKLLFDENLSRRLVALLADLYPGSSHVVHAGLAHSPDTAIWDYAKSEEFAIVTTDADFFELATVFGPPPKVIWLRRWNHPTKNAELVLRREAVRIAEFEANRTRGLLVLEYVPV